MANHVEQSFARSATLIRINSRDAEVEEDRAIGTEGSALDVLAAINAVLSH